MPNQRDPEKRLVGFWLSPVERRDLYHIVVNLGLDNRNDWLRSKIKQDLKTLRLPSGKPSRRSAS